MIPLLAAAIISTTVSNSSTGGNVAGPGGYVENGASGASSYSQVSVNGSSYSSYNSSEGSGGGVTVTSDNSNGDGNVTVHVTTDTNGVVHDETITKPINDGVSIDVGTSSGAVGTSVHVRADFGPLPSVQRAARNAIHSASSTSVSASTSISINAATGTPAFDQIGFSAQIKAFFKHLFSMFGF